MYARVSLQTVGAGLFALIESRPWSRKFNSARRRLDRRMRSAREKRSRT